MRILTESESTVKEYNKQKTPKDDSRLQLKELIQKSIAHSNISSSSSVRNINANASGSVDSKIHDHTSQSS